MYKQDKSPNHREKEPKIRFPSGFYKELLAFQEKSFKSIYLELNAALINRLRGKNKK